MNNKNRSSKTICYIGNFSFPKGNAAGMRVLANGYLFRELGYDVIYFGLSKVKIECNEKDETLKIFDGFKYFLYPYPKSLKDWIFFTAQYKDVISKLNEINPFAVIAYGSLSNSIFGLLLAHWCKMHGVKIIADCVDWLAGGVGGLLFRIGKRIDTEIQKRYVNAISDGVIVVSDFLMKYYTKKGCKTLLLPPLSRDALLPIEISKKDDKESSKVNIAYAGFPFPTNKIIKNTDSFKDRLDICIEMLSKIDNLDYVFNIFGITKEEYLRVLPNHQEICERLKHSIVFHGYKSNDEVMQMVAVADYFFLYRDQNKMTRSGFPSKIVEALSIGIPIITTDTSDIKKYIQNNKNGFFLEGNGILERTDELERILKKNTQELRELKDECRTNNPFHRKNFIESTKLFMDTI